MNQIRQTIKELAALKHTPWYRWHPQIALRYLPVVEWIRRKFKIQNSKLKISVLEVGSGGLGIVPYLNRPVTGVDVQFDKPIHPMLKPETGDATKLEFANDSFDIVLSVDMLEHLPKEKRKKAIDEMVRVAKKAVVVGVPCGTLSLVHDKQIQESYKKRFGKEFPFAEEHIKFGLPEEEDIFDAIRFSGKRHDKHLSIDMKGNLNLKLRGFLMWGWINDNIIVNILFRKLFLLFIPLFRIIDRPPYYRKIFFVTITERRI